jgi:hypothetical protein
MALPETVFHHLGWATHLIFVRAIFIFFHGPKGPWKFRTSFGNLFASIRKGPKLGK